MEGVFGDPHNAITRARHHDLQRDTDFAWRVRERGIVVDHGFAVNDLVVNTVLVVARGVDVIDVPGAFQRVINAVCGEACGEAHVGDKADVRHSVMRPAVGVDIVGKEKIVVHQSAISLDRIASHLGQIARKGNVSKACAAIYHHVKGECADLFDILAELNADNAGKALERGGADLLHAVADKDVIKVIAAEIVIYFGYKRCALLVIVGGAAPVKE